jgi:hypothetical protein
MVRRPRNIRIPRNGRRPRKEKIMGRWEKRERPEVTLTHERRKENRTVKNDEREWEGQGKGGGNPL